MEPEDLLAVQRARVMGGATRSVSARREALDALWEGLERHEDDLLEALYRDLGKSRMEAFTSELCMVRAEIRLARRRMHRWMRPQKRRVPSLAWPGHAEVHPDPCGSVLVIGPWNYPVQLLLGPLVGILASGNGAVLKPSEFAPLTGLAIENLISCSLASDTAAVVQGDAGFAARLVGMPFDHIFFTGGETAGRKVLAAAAEHLTPTTLELGGKCPVMVLPRGKSAAATLDLLRIAAKRIAWGKYLNAGQTCVAPDFVLVERKYHDPLVAALKEAYTSFGLVDHGRIVNMHHFDRLSACLREGHIAHGGGYDAATLRMDPTVLIDLPDTALVLQEEIFGPILPVVSCESMDEMAARCQRLSPPLALYLFTDDRDIVRKVTESTVSGAVCVNDTVVQATGADIPLGGVGRSGMGRYHGRDGFNLFVRPRTILRRPLRPDFSFRYPPLKISFQALKKFSRFF